LVHTQGLNGGFALQDELTVVLSAKIPQSGVCFQMSDSSEPAKVFVIKIVDRDKIAHARRVLSGEESSRVDVQGKIVKVLANFNPGWGFHVDPDSGDFFELQIEVCDATIKYVEENLEEVGGSTLPNFHWCPWSSKLVREMV
jgi:hypothetical protein